jgi:hypothetical protein
MDGTILLGIIGGIVILGIVVVFILIIAGVIPTKKDGFANSTVNKFVNLGKKSKI